MGPWLLGWAVFTPAMVFLVNILVSRVLLQSEVPLSKPTAVFEDLRFVLMNYVCSLVEMQQHSLLSVTIPNLIQGFHGRAPFWYIRDNSWLGGEIFWFVGTSHLVEILPNIFVILLDLCQTNPSRHVKDTSRLNLRILRSSEHGWNNFQCIWDSPYPRSFQTYARLSWELGDILIWYLLCFSYQVSLQKTYVWKSWFPAGGSWQL